MTPASVYDFEPGPEQPADVRRAATAVRGLLHRLGLPPRGPDGAHQVLLAFALPTGTDIRLSSFAAALEELADPQIRRVLREAQAQAVATPMAALIFAMDCEGNYWCAPVGTFTGAGERADA